MTGSALRFLRYRIRRHVKDEPEKLDAFWGWVAEFNDGHEEFIGPLCKQRIGIEKYRRAIRRRYGTDQVKTLRLAWFRETPRHA